MAASDGESHARGAATGAQMGRGGDGVGLVRAVGLPGSGSAGTDGGVGILSLKQPEALRETSGGATMVTSGGPGTSLG